MDTLSFFVAFTLLLAHFGLGQENAGTNISPSLEICYNNTLFVTREYRLPSTIPTLIELIRKIENGNPNLSARELAFDILHRYRQDGIRRTRKNVDASLGLPFSPRGWEAYKNRVQLKKLTPGNALNFNNNSLSDLEACSFHFMISSTIETLERGDEQTVCSRLGHFQLRDKRQAELTGQQDNSICPIEGGVVYSKWGAVKAGLVFSGIAAGFEPNPIRTANGTIDSAYASTLAGELSEVALNQPQLDAKKIGNSGAWNSTVLPKYYFLTQSDIEHLYLTDAEIRGSLDGLYLALNINAWKNRQSNIKISQILEMYYGQGVFNSSARACNRKALLQDEINDDKLVQQTTLFNDLLDQESQYGYTPNKATFPLSARNAVDSFRSYLRELNDLQCNAENDVIERVSTDLLIFVDVAWDNRFIEPLISYILQNIEVNGQQSSYTIFDGVKAEAIVNKSRSIIDFYEQFNLTQQQNYPSGFDYTRVIARAQSELQAKLDNATDLTGQSTIILLLPRNPPSPSEAANIQTLRNDYFKSRLPDLKIIVAGGGSPSSYNDLVTNPQNDIVNIVGDTIDDSSLKETGKSIIERVQKVPRSIVNPNCGSSFSSSSASNFEITDYVGPAAVNYYKISSNYFYNSNTLKIRGQGYGTLTVCLSRTYTNPRENDTNSNCKPITSDEVSVDTSNYCSGSGVADCPPIYISVEGKTSLNRCTEKACRFPDGIKYSIGVENADCSSSSESLLGSLLFVSILLYLTKNLV